MPWSVEDVESHKKGLSDKGKRQWVRIANSVLKREMKKGKSEKEAAASAIKQANGVVNNNVAPDKCASYTTKQVDYDVQFTVHQGKPYMILPVVMMVEGVHHGSRGPLLHSIADLGKYPESWNGIPVVIYHPTGEDGQAVSANDPEIVDTVKVGTVYHTKVEDKKLKAEVWLDEDKLNDVSPETLAMIDNGQEIEVSLGMFTEDDEVEGEWNGEKYTAIAHNHVPDHLALLPGQVGACSCADGCGLGANDRSTANLLLKVRNEGYMAQPMGLNFADGFKQILNKIQELLNGYNSDHGYYYLEDANEMFFVYTIEEKGKNGMYRQEYRYESGKIELIDDPVEVHRKVDYVVNVEQKKEENMAKECTPCIKAKVDALIANNDGKYTEDDREQLQTLTETLLDKIAKPIEKEVEVVKEVNVLSDAQKAAIAAFEKMQKEKRDALIKGILDNTKDVWTEDKLKVMDDETLQSINKSVVKEEAVVDYSAMSGRAFQTNADDAEPLYPTGFGQKKEDK